MIRKNRPLLIIILLIVPIQVNAQIPTPENRDEHEYYGYSYGAAGIVDNLLFYYNLTHNQDTKSVITETISKLWDLRADVNGVQYPIWSKRENGDIYAGIKYGATGIANMLLNAYKILDDPVYLSYAEQTMKYLYGLAKNSSSPSWGYAFANITSGAGDVPITDRKFGSLGIIEVLVTLYEETSNNLYLDMALNATSWLYSVSTTRVFGNDKVRLLPWFENDNITQLSGLQLGNAGLLKVLYRINKLIDLPYLTSWYDSLLNWYIIQQNLDGSWYYNFKSGDVIVSNYDIGVSGILSVLITLNSTQTRNTVESGLEWLFSKFIHNGTHTFIPEYNHEIFGWTSLERGLAGVMLTILDIYEQFPDLIPNDIFKDAYGWLLTDAKKSFRYRGDEYSGIIPRSDIDEFIDLSHADGIAGILKLLIRTKQSSLIFTLDIADILDANIEDIVDILINLRNENGLWYKQFTIKDENQPVGTIIVLLLMIPILVYLIGKTKKN